MTGERVNTRLEDVGARLPEPVKRRRDHRGRASPWWPSPRSASTCSSRSLSLDGAIDQLKSADWWWVGTALVVSLFTAFTDTAATLGAVKVSVAYGPAVVLQYAQKFTGLVVLSSSCPAAMRRRAS